MLVRKNKMCPYFCADSADKIAQPSDTLLESKEILMMVSKAEK